MELAQSLKTFTSFSSSFSLFLAPPAWGKTSILLKLFDLYDEEQVFVFVSPLRALAEEFYKRLKSERYKSVILIRSFQDMKQVEKGDKRIIILTPETMGTSYLRSIAGKRRKPLFILDEFHLYYYWGEGFRPLLWETCMGIANSGASILGLSATMEKKLLDKWKSDFSLGMNQKFLIDLGNQKLLNKPQKEISFSLLSSKFLNRRLVRDLSRQKEGEVFLCFCQYRTEVDYWVDYCLRRGYEALGCKGGEVGEFIDALEKNPRPRVIFSTSALSHGVNLPVITKVYINYAVENKDFWNQMIGRGGRDGTRFNAYHMDRKKGVLLDTAKIICRDLLAKVG